MHLIYWLVDASCIFLSFKAVVFCVVDHFDEENAHTWIQHLEQKGLLAEHQGDSCCYGDVQNCKPDHTILCEERYKGHILVLAESIFYF